MTWSEQGEGGVAVWDESAGGGDERDIGVGQKQFAGCLGVLGVGRATPTLVRIFISSHRLWTNILQ